MAAGPGTIVAALLLPPLGVYLARGAGRDFWIACGLTLLGFLPGVAFALYTVLRPSVAAASANPQERRASA